VNPPAPTMYRSFMRLILLFFNGHMLFAIYHSFW
jgi:hypothetical protein